MLAAQRWRWFGHPAFLLAVAVLAVNDHVLKARFGTWWTGKLSDVAGLVVVGVAAAVLVGPRRGLPVAAAAFVALKAVPGVAEAAAPVLGGVTRRDPADLVALAGLVPVGFLLGRAGVREQAPEPVCARPALEGAGARRAGGASAAVAVIGATLAVFTCTATSCSAEDAVVALYAREGTVFARIDRGAAPGADWARSDDAGETWSPTRRPADLPARPADPVVQSSGSGSTTTTWPGTRPVAGPLRGCLDDGTCYELDPHAIVRVSPSGARRTAFDLDRWDHGRIANGCGRGVERALETIAVVDHGGKQIPIVGLGSAGVLVRSDHGGWEQRDVLSLSPPDKVPDPQRSLHAIAASLIVVAGVAVIGLVRGWRSWLLGVGASAVCWVVWMLIALATAVLYISAPLSVAAVVWCWVLTAVAGVVVGRWEPVGTPLAPPPLNWDAVPRPDLPPPPDGPGDWRLPPPA